MVSSRLNRFNWIAAAYDAVSRLVFGGEILQSQVHFLDRIPDGGNVLILGGGAGQILVELLRRKPSCTIYYIEASSSMIDLARKKARSQSGKIVFIHGTESQIPQATTFDTVITNFFLDLFSTATLNDVIGKIKPVLTARGNWLVAEFVEGRKFSQRLLLTIMYWFFRLTCKIEATRLPLWERQLGNHGLHETESHFYCNSFIKSAVFSKDPVA